MPETPSLDKANPLLPAEDYVALRKQGFKHIEKLGSDIWTDYNNSDPGITILEAVCYAITDLSYRTGFEIKDIIAPQNLTDDTWKQIFYTARQILHNTPLTISDYRKLIIDVKGVRNAWIQKSKDYEVPVWVDYNYAEAVKDDNCSCEEKNKLCYGRLQVNTVSSDLIGDYKTARQNELQKPLGESKKKEIELSGKIHQLGNADNDSAKSEKYGKLENRLNKVHQQIEILNDLGKKVKDLTKANFIPFKIVEFEGLYNVMIEYEEDVLQEDHRESVRQLVTERLARNRNLCEDFLSVNAVDYEDIGLGIFAVLEEYADPDVVLAQIFFIIYKYFTPSVPFHTIEQMLDKGYPVYEIFEGPPLKHGFIDTIELEKTDLFRDIRLSDIINEISDIKDIKAITYLHLPFDGLNDPLSARDFFNQWVKYLQEERKIARIIPEKSQVIFCKERDKITYYTGRKEDRRPNRMLKLFKDLKTIESKYKLSGHQIDFTVPAGEYMELEDYYPVTYSLPVCYGVSERAGLPADADDKRKVQALQLKGYMLFFEQILSDYLVRLNHLKDLFSFDDNIQHNSFIRSLYSATEYDETQLSEMEDLKALLIDHGNRGEDNRNEILKDFTGILQNLLEPPELFNKRRNRFLNHMLARFSEDMSEYEAISRWLTPHKVEDRLIKDKIRLLKNGEYNKISTQRGKGFDYTKYPVWDTDNISGAERRVSRLLGFKDASRRTLAAEYVITEAKENGKNVIKLLDPENKQTILLTSVEVKDGCCTELLINQILEHADDRRYFTFLNGSRQRNRRQNDSAGPFWFDLYDSTDPDTAVWLASSERFETQKDRENAFDSLKELLNKINNNEGLHLVEHLLLRPKLDEVLDERNEPVPVSFLNICLDGCDLGIGDKGEAPLYRKKIHRIPAAKCYDQMPWILEYFKISDGKSMLFQQAFPDGSDPLPLKFRRYELLAKRVRDLQEYGSERINYEIVSNDNDVDKKYSFIIHGDKGETLAQSDFIYVEKEIIDISDPMNPAGLMRYFGFELDLYCEEDPCDNNEDPYSFRNTVILPCWPKRFRDATFRNLVEKTIQTEFPAHIHTRIVWVGMQEMKEFERVYRNWLEAMAQTEMPPYEALNPLVKKLNSLKPCGSCEEECNE